MRIHGNRTHDKLPCLKPPTAPQLMNLFRSLNEMEDAAHEMGRDMEMGDLFCTQREILDNPNSFRRREDMQTLAVTMIAEKQAMEEIPGWKDGATK